MKRRLTPSLTPIRIVTFVVALVCALALMGPHLSRPLSAQSKATATNVPVIPHEAVPNFFKNPPGIYTGENMGIATNSKGNIYIYHRANETRLFEYTPAGMFVREIGRGNYGFAFAHSVRVDDGRIFLVAVVVAVVVVAFAGRAALRLELSVENRRRATAGLLAAIVLGARPGPCVVDVAQRRFSFTIGPSMRVNFCSMVTGFG